jgi:hypothetical protein
VALGINKSGQIVGTMLDAITRATSGFVYDNGTVKTLDEIASTTGWHFAQALAINDKDDVIGWGTPPGTMAVHGFVLRLVLTPSQMLDQMVSMIDAFALNSGTADSLKAKLAAIRSSLDTDNNAACNQLNAFMNEVNAQDGKKLSSDEAAKLRAVAASLSGAIGC